MLVTMTAAPGEMRETDHVRMVAEYGNYLLERLYRDTTRITWQQYVDPGGSLPAWLVNSMLTDLPFRSLQSFRELVTTEPYSQMVFTYDDKGTPIDLVIAPQQ